MPAVRRPRRRGCAVVVAVVCALVTACGAPQETGPAYWPTDGWRSTSPEAQGMESSMLSRVFRFVEHSQLPVHSLLVVRHGSVVLDASFYPSLGTEPHDIAECTETVVATLYARALAEGRVPPPAARVTDALGMPAIVDDVAWSRMTIDDALTMRTGLVYDAATDDAALRAASSPSEFALALRGDTLPGTEFARVSVAPTLVASVVEAGTGEALAEFAAASLFEPLGIDAPTWASTPDGSADASGGLRLWPGDLAKLGFLYLHEGVWEGQQLLPLAWARSATSRADLRIDQLPEEDIGYGRGWQALGDGAFSTRGRGGQLLIVDRPNDLVVVIFASTSPERSDELLQLWTDYVVPAIRTEGPLEPNRQAADALAARAARAMDSPRPRAVSARPASARSVDGVWYVLDANEMGVARLRLDVLDPVGSLVLDWPQARATIPLGFAGVPVRLERLPSNVPLRGPLAGAASWNGDGSLQVELETIGAIDRWSLRFEFGEFGLRVSAEERTEGIPGFVWTGVSERMQR